MPTTKEIFANYYYRYLTEENNWISNFRDLPRDQQNNILALPTYYAKAEQFDRVVEIITNFDFMLTKIKVKGINNVCLDYELIPDQLESTPSIKLIKRALTQSSHILEQDKNQLASQLIGRMLDLVEEYPIIGQLITKARNYRGTNWIQPLLRTLTSANSPLIRTLTGHSDPVYSVAIAPDSTIISGSDDKTIKIWNPSTGQCLSTLTGHSSWVYSVAIAPDSTIISGSDDNTIKIWNPSTGRELATFYAEYPIISLAVASDSTIIAGDEFGNIHYFKYVSTDS